MRTHPSSSPTTLLLITTTCLLSTPSSSEALLLPNLIGAISTRHRLQHRRQQQQLQRRGNESTSTLADGSITLTIDDEDPRGLWNIMPNNRSHHHSEQRRVLRFGFNWFRGSQHHHHNTRRAAHQQLEEEHVIQRQVQQSIRPHGPVLRGGTLEDVILLPSSSISTSGSAAALTMAHSSATTTSSNKLRRGIWSHVRTTMRGIRHSVLHSSASHDYEVDHYNNDDVVLRMNPTNQNVFDRHGDGAAVNNMSVLRLGGVISRHLKHKKMTKKLQMNRSVGLLDGVEVVTAARGGDATTVSSSSSTSTSSSSASMSTTHSDVEETTFTIDTPLFPIILPKSWEAPIMGTTTSSSSQTPTTTTSSSSTYIQSLEITIAPPESPTTPNQPTPTQLTQVTQPLIPTSSWETFTGLEFYQPQSYDGLVSTGVLLASVGSDEYISWCGEKKTDKFVREHGDSADGSSSSWYEALDASQEVLVWSGKAIGGKESGMYGAELPIIKSTSIIHKSPKYLAELLMDSSKVKAYNKMSLGREDVEVFQTGVDTMRGEGTFGNEGESKIVRNLTRPPMVNSNLEFVTCMHARKLSAQDLQTLSSNNNDPNQPTNGYIVVSRAVTGGQWNSDDSGNVRNEIILGVNILREVPNAPDKTEMIAVTHVYSPLIPLMLAKNAGVKGAVDFVRDIRSLP